MPEILNLHVPATADGMEIIHRELANCWSILEHRRSLDSRWTAEFTLAVAEVAANIVQYSAHPNTPLMQFGLSLTHHPDRLVAHVVDQGLEATLPDAPVMPSVSVHPEELGERGRGLALVQATTDRFEYQRTSEGQNIWIIEKHISG